MSPARSARSSRVGHGDVLVNNAAIFPARRVRKPGPRALATRSRCQPHPSLIAIREFTDQTERLVGVHSRTRNRFAVYLLAGFRTSCALVAARLSASCTG